MNRWEEMRNQVIAFHRVHPEVWTEFARLTKDRIARGFTKYSARTVWHVMRWHLQGPTIDEAFKLNDHYSPFYARAFMRLHRDHQHFFELRVQKSKHRPAKGHPDTKPPAVDPTHELDERDEWPIDDLLG